MPGDNTFKISRMVRSEAGIALVTALMLTLISLGIIMSLMYLITSGIQRTGASKRYKNALEASYGGAELITKDLLPLILQNISDPQLINILNAAPYTGTNLVVGATQQCLQAKLKGPTTSWPSACDASLNPKSQPDFTLTLPGANNQFTVYSKVVDTVGGNTDISGLQLGGAGVAEGQTVLSPQHFPYVYRLEIRAEKASNAVEKSNISVLYAY